MLWWFPDAIACGEIVDSFLCWYQDMVVGGGNLGFMLLRHSLAGFEEWRVR